MSKHLKTNHLQVLVDDEMLQQLNRLIMIEAFQNNQKPKSASAYVRNLIEERIAVNSIELKFYNAKEVHKQVYK